MHPCPGARVLRGSNVILRLQKSRPSVINKFILKGYSDLRLIHLILIVLAVLALAVGDVFLKKAALETSLWRALKSPWMVGALALYLYQIIFVTYFFFVGWELSIVGTLQAAVYGLVVVIVGIFYFEETLTPTQTVGVVLAFSGVILLNTP